MPVVLLSSPEHSLGVWHPAGHPEAWLLPGDTSFLVPFQRGQSQCDLTLCPRARMLRVLPFLCSSCHPSLPLAAPSVPI